MTPIPFSWALPWRRHWAACWLHHITNFKDWRSNIWSSNCCNSFPVLTMGQSQHFTSLFSHPLTVKFPCPPALTPCQATFLLPARFILSASTGGLQRGSFGEQQGLSSEPAQPLHGRIVPQGSASALTPQLRQDQEQISLPWKKPSVKSARGAGRKSWFRKIIPWTPSLGRAEQCCAVCLAGTELAQPPGHTHLSTKIFNPLYPAPILSCVTMSRSGTHWEIPSH